MASVGEFNNVLLTTAGKEMIAQTQNGQKLKITKVVIGDGILSNDDDPTTFKTVKNARMEAPIADFTDVGAGVYSVEFRMTNKDIEKGFWMRELGVMAQLEGGEETLYAYTHVAGQGNFVYDKTTPLQERVYDLDFVVGDTQNLEVVINDSVVYITKKYFEERMAERDKAEAKTLTEHDENTDAHAAAFKAHNDDLTAHKDFQGATAAKDGVRGFVPAPAKGQQEGYCLCGDGKWHLVLPEGGTADKVLSGAGTWVDGGINLLKRNKAYVVGDIAYSPKLPSWAYLECTKAGTTGDKEPTDLSKVTVSSVGG